MFYWFTLFNYYTFTVGTFKVFNFKKKTQYTVYVCTYVYILYIFFSLSLQFCLLHGLGLGWKLKGL